MILDDARARAVVDKAVSLSSADETRVSLHGERRANTRFACDTVTTCGDVASVSLQVRASFGKRHAAATTTDLDDDAIERAVRTAEELAHAAPEDPEHMPELPPQEYLEVDRWAASTAEARAQNRAQAVQAAIQQAEADNLHTSGYFEHGQGLSAVGNSSGLFAWSRGTDAAFSVTMRTDDGSGSGWASSNSRDIGEVDSGEAVRLAAEKARAARDPRPLAPGVYPVILEPQAVSNLLGVLLWCLDARDADEGRSFFARPGGGNKIGRKVAGDNITIRSDPAHSAVPSCPFHADGLPATPQSWIEAGLLKQLTYSRFWAQKQNAQPTGRPSNLIMDGGQGTVGDLVRQADRAVLVTRFWYIRFLDPQTILLTGLTRDGTFWVEDGQIRHGLRNFRFNESPVALLNHVTAMSAPVRVENAFVPAIAAGEFTFASASASV
jgi:predicted Zn-dependent protease